MRRYGWLTATLLVIALTAAVAEAQEAAAETSCTLCHGNVDFFGDEASLVADYAGGVHAAAGLSCHDCHGGNPSPELAEDMDAAKDESLDEHPWIGGPSDKTEVPGFCGSCHSDPVYMRRFQPDARVDQEAEYWTSQHGMALAAGDTTVAACVDCHGAHGIRGPESTDSKVHPTAVASMCASCHSDAERMAGRTLEDGRPLPIDQHSRWQRSVHAAAMFEREDLSAPTCNDCHGNHGAAPPGLASVTYVCGQCHGREAELFRASPKHSGYQEHNEFLADVAGEGCAACHEPAPAGIGDATHLSECASCHMNHGIVRPTVGMYGSLPDTPCYFCHLEPRLMAADGAASERGQEIFANTLDELLAETAAAGLEGVDAFDYLVDRSRRLAEHVVPDEVAAGDSPTLRPEFALLFRKFRIGKTYYTYTDLETGDEVRVDVIRCSSCHLLDEEQDLATGAAGGVELLRRMQDLTRLTARAERLLLRARRGGVETREALVEIDQAVDAQIGLQVLAHTFSVAEDGPFVEQHEEGRRHAEAALRIGEEALEELAFRRRGLAVALVVIALLLATLALKIRQLSAAPDPPAGEDVASTTG